MDPVRPGARVRLDHVDPRSTGSYRNEEEARARLEKLLERLAKLQDVLWAERKHAVLIVLQGVDAAGKDGTIKRVMAAMNPSGCTVVPFKVPTEEEAAHDFLWRVHRATPRRGYITIFNRSHYEDVIVPFVDRGASRRDLEPRYAQINAFERGLADSDTLVLKFFLHVSQREQRRRLWDRLEDPTKNWKFSLDDVEKSKRWARYTKAYESVLERSSTAVAPWYVVPADRKWYRNVAVAEVLVEAIAGLRCRYPPPALPAAQLEKLRRRLRTWKGNVR